MALESSEVTLLREFKVSSVLVALRLRSQEIRPKRPGIKTLAMLMSKDYIK